MSVRITTSSYILYYIKLIHCFPIRISCKIALLEKIKFMKEKKKKFQAHLELRVIRSQKVY